MCVCVWGWLFVCLVCFFLPGEGGGEAAPFGQGGGEGRRGLASTGERSYFFTYIRSRSISIVILVSRFRRFSSEHMPRPPLLCVLSLHSSLYIHTCIYLIHTCIYLEIRQTGERSDFLCCICKLSRFYRFSYTYMPRPPTPVCLVSTYISLHVYLEIRQRVSGAMYVLLVLYLYLVFCRLFLLCMPRSLASVHTSLYLSLSRK